MYSFTGQYRTTAFTASGNPLVTFEVKERNEVMKMADSFADGSTVALKVNKHRQKRSTDANSYYWCLLGKLATAQKISTSKCHNIMLRRYGVLEEFDGKAVYIVVPDTEEAEKKADESETYHIKPTSQVKEGKDGKTYRTYILLKGSSSYDTAEMSNLIAGVRDECFYCGIPYETPDEILQLLSLMEGK